MSALTATDDFLEGVHDQPLVIEPAALLANDTGDAQDRLQIAVSLEDGPYAGSLDLGLDGSLTYRPNPGYVGSDSFRYYVGDVDGYSPKPATVSITVRPGSATSSGVIIWNPSIDPCSVMTVVMSPAGPNGVSPSYATSDCYRTREDTPLVISGSGVLANDGPAGSLLLANLHTPPEHGTVELRADGSFTYAPAQDFFGWDRFIYESTSGSQAPLLQTVAIEVTPVNDAPVVRDDSVQAESGVPLAITAQQLKANDQDVDNAWLMAALPLANLPEHGTLALRTGKLFYASGPAYRGADSFQYFATDGELISERRALVELTVRAPVRHNAALASDVNQDDRVTAIDALLSINYLNAFGPTSVARAAALSGELLDVNNDDAVSAKDVLLIINELNAGQAIVLVDVNDSPDTELPSESDAFPADLQIGLFAELLASRGRRRSRS